MASTSLYYKGKRKQRNYVTIPLIVVLALIAALIVVFYALQKYAVITKDGISIEIPGITAKEIVVDEQGHEVRVFEEVSTNIIFDSPDYSGVEQTVKGNAKPIRAIFVSYDQLDTETVMNYANRLSAGNSLVLEMKPAVGSLMWNTSADIAVNYGIFSETAITKSLPTLITNLKERNVYLAAQISCCVDYMLPTRCQAVGLRNQYGTLISDDKGTYLDPYNTQVRDYVVTMVRELYDMGFDEVILENVIHPTATDADTTFVYTKAMSTTPSPVNAVCGFAVSIAEELSDRKGVLSIYVNSPTALAKADVYNGQDAALFFKIYDRVYYTTDRYTYTYNCQDVENKINVGELYDRFVPVVYNYLPDTTSWVLIDTGNA